MKPAAGATHTPTSIRLTAAEAAALREHWDTPGAGAQACVRSWLRQHRQALHDLRGRFRRAELCLILDALNGLHLIDELGGQHLHLEVHDHIALNGADTRWGVSSARLLGALATLSRVEAEHVERWGATFWHDPDRDLDTYVARLLLPLSTQAATMIALAQQAGGTTTISAALLADGPAAIEALRDLVEQGLAAATRAEDGGAVVVLTERGRGIAIS